MEWQRKNNRNGRKTVGVMEQNRKARNGGLILKIGGGKINGKRDQK